MKHLVLVGGGHAHVIMLEQLINKPCPSLKISLISPTKKQAYSGMLPGWINNTYALETCQIDLQNLCSRAGVTFILGKLAHFNAQQQQLVLHDESALDYDLLSLAIGSQPNLVGDIAALNEWVAVKPFDAFTQTWQTWQQQLNLKLPATLTIAGGGAGALEIALAARHMMPYRAKLEHKIIIYAGPNGVMSGFNSKVRHLIMRQLKKAHITLVYEYIDFSQAMSANVAKPSMQNFHLRVSTAKPALSFGDSGLALDAEGFVLVDEFQRSVSHPNVFAAGDICSRPTTHLQRSGVHAIRAGKQLAYNLLATNNSATLRAYWPRHNNLYLISCADQSAIASYGFNLGPFKMNVALHGRWVWRLKNHIDISFMNRFKAK